MLTEEQWNLIDEKYGMLLAKICHKISGDSATCGFDDNLQDLRIAVIEAVKGFEKQQDGVNGTFDDFWGTKGFDRYIKTCLWNLKNNKGSNVTKKSNLYKNVVSVNDNEEVLNLEGMNSSSTENCFFVEELSLKMNKVQSSILKMVARDHKFIKSNGKLNVSKLADALNMSRYDVEGCVKDMSDLFSCEI